MIAAMRAGAALVVLALGCGSSAVAPDAAVTSPADAAVMATADVPADSASALDPALAAQARAIAAAYPAWGRIDDELRWAPFLCRIPLPGLPRMSASSDSATH